METPEARNSPDGLDRRPARVRRHERALERAANAQARDGQRLLKAKRLDSARRPPLLLYIAKANASAIGTLVERTAGYTMLVHLPNGYKPEPLDRPQRDRDEPSSTEEVIAA